MNAYVTVPRADPGTRVVVIYDKTTGRIFQRHGETRIVEDKAHAPEQPTSAKGHGAPVPTRFELAAVLEKVGDKRLLGLVTGGDRANLALLEVDPGADLQGAMVDLESQRIVPQPALHVTSDKTELDGDGQAVARIRVEARDAGGTRSDFSGEVKVTTTRGRLSARGGLVELKAGVAELTLTSANETVARVEVRASCAIAPCAPGRLVLEFV